MNFDKAILKLSVLYTAILLIISIGFSSIVYTVTTGGMNKRPAFTRPDNSATSISSSNNTEDENFNQQMEELIRARDAAVQSEILTSLVFLNLVVVCSGAIASYFLARWTLRPIREAHEKEARFVSDASHELRTPLTAISMENEVLLRDKKATREDLREQVESNLEEIRKLQNLVNCLLQLSKNEKLEIIPVDLSAILGEVKGKITPLAATKKIRIETDISNLTQTKIKAEPMALASLLGIILENAVKYSPAQTVIRIITENGKISIVDQGQGIPEDDLPHIFERFYRAEKSRTSEGYGLGLSLAQNLAEQLHMKITVANNAKKGTTFSIIFS